MWGLLQVLHSLLGFASAARAASRAFKDDANQPPSAASALADASTINASIVMYHTDRTGWPSPSQRRPRRRLSKRLSPAMSSRNGKRGSVCGFPTLCGFPTDMQISYRWVYGFLIVGFQGIGWARLFCNINSILPLAAGVLLGLSSASIGERVFYIRVHANQDKEKAQKRT